MCAYTTSLVREGEERSKRKIEKKLRNEYGYNERLIMRVKPCDGECGANIGVPSI